MRNVYSICTLSFIVLNVVIIVKSANVVEMKTK